MAKNKDSVNKKKFKMPKKLFWCSYKDGAMGGNIDVFFKSIKNG